MQRLEKMMVAREKWITTLIGFALGFFCLNAQAENWPQFRGVRASGEVESNCPRTWDSSKNVRWKTPIAGEGWSCPVVWGDSVFLTTAVRVDTDSESSQPEPYRGGGGWRRSDLIKAEYRWELACLDTQTGELRWRQVARQGYPTIPRHSSNSYATETPVTDGSRVYAYFGMMGLYCYDMAGRLQWQKDLGTYETRAGWGTASSPLLFAGKLFLQIDNQEQSFLVALDADTGDEIWRVERNEVTQYSTPIIWRNSQRNELIAGGEVTRSYDPATGKLLWELDMAKGRSSATPLVVGDRLYVGTEFRNRGGPDDGGGFLFAVKPGGTGDITPSEDAGSSQFVAWKTAESGIQMASAVLCRGHLYLLERRLNIVNCIDAETGEKVYRTRISGSRPFWASPWTCDGSVYCLDEAGTTFVLAGGSEFEVLRRNEIDERAWSSPAVANGMLFLRTIDNLYCIAESGR